MGSRRKYNGPCPEHLSGFKSGCKHCNAYSTQRRYYGGNVPPPERKYDRPLQRLSHTWQGVEIYRGLHWPAPEFT